MAEYIKNVLILLFAGALVVLFLTLGLAILAALAIALPVLYWWYRWRLRNEVEETRKKGGYGRTRVIDVEYEIVDDGDDRRRK